MNNSEYIDLLLPIVEPIAEEYNLPTSLILGVSLVETDNGSNDEMISSNNAFKTKEDNNFSSLEESVRFWCESIKNDKTKKQKQRYEALFGVTDYKRAVIILQRSGYMISTQILLDTISVHELYKYDKVVEEEPNHIYYVRKHWNDSNNQLLETEDLTKANEFASKNKEYKVYNENGVLVTDPWAYNVNDAYRVKKNWSDEESLITTRNLDKAKECSIQYQDYKVFDIHGNVIYDYWNSLPKVVETPRLQPAITPYKGRKVELKETPLYLSVLDNTPSRLVSGTYYFFNDVIIDGKCRVTAVQNDSNPSHCLGLVNLYDLN